MEVSILQHAKDKSPRQVVVDELVSQMRSASWPEGYQPLAVFSAVVEGGLQKKNVRWLTGLCIVKLRIKREELRDKREELRDDNEDVRGKGELVRDDPHTKLCWNDVSGGMYVVFDYEAVYSQAYALYLQGYEYYFSDAENQFINERNKQRFCVSDPEQELVEEYFRRPTENNPGEFITSSRAADIVSTFSYHVKPVAIGRALARYGFESGRQGNSRGYYVVVIPPEERKRRAVSLAYDAMIKRRQSSTSSEQADMPNQPDTPDVF